MQTVPVRTDAWIGLVGAAPASGSVDPDLVDVAGVYVNAVAIAADEQEFMRHVTSTLAELDLEATEFENIEPLYIRMTHARPDPELMRLVDELSTDTPVLFGTSMPTGRTTSRKRPKTREAGRRPASLSTAMR
jgi:hypothetical protein